MPIQIFFCYAHEDEALLNMLKRHLRPLQRLGRINTWHDRDISAGDEWEQEITERINTANIILLLISPNFMDSDYCYGKEMKRALERHERKEVHVIPIILRPIYWQGVLGKLQALPKDGIPIVNQTWHSIDDALFDAAEGIRKIIEELAPQIDVSVPTVAPQIDVSVPTVAPQSVTQEPLQTQTMIEPKQVDSPPQRPPDIITCKLGHVNPVGSVLCNECGEVIPLATVQQHVNLLKRGVKIWNQWRKKHSEIELDLSGADLSGADLSDVDLIGAKLTGTKLIGADLSGARLIGANLSDADLSSADLIGANLSYTNLNGTKLSYANLSYANLSGAIDINTKELEMQTQFLQNTILPNGSKHR